MGKFETVLLQNMDLLERIPPLRNQAVKFLLRLSPVQPCDILSIKTIYSSSYALASEKQSDQFLKIMARLLKYIGTGPVGPSKHWEYPWALANLKLRPGMSVLDAGCGKSPIQFLLSDIGMYVTGVDPFENVSWHGIDGQLVNRFGCKIQYRCEGIENMSFEDDTFDRVCCLSVIEHCHASNVGSKVDNEKMTPQTEEDRRLQHQMMREMVRVLKPGGLLVVTVDFNMPRSDCLLESNVDVANLLSVDGVELYGRRCPEPFPGEKDFDPYLLIEKHEIDIVNYAGTLQTSIGFTLRKKNKVTSVNGAQAVVRRCT